MSNRLWRQYSYKPHCNSGNYRVPVCKFFFYCIHILQEDLKKCIHEMLPKALFHRPLKLIIIDSITAVFRGEYTLNEAPRRSKDLRDVAFHLHKLSVEHGLWVICVNQVLIEILNKDILL